MRAKFFEHWGFGSSRAALLLAVLALLAEPVAGQSCSQVAELLRQGYGADEIAQATGMSGGQLRDCASQLRAGFSAVGPVPRGAAGPAPHGAPGPAPHGAPGPAPFGAAGPAPHGAAGPAPHGAAGPAPSGAFKIPNLP